MRGRLWLTYLAVLLAGAGLLMVGLSQRVHRWAPPPVPPASAALDRQAPDFAVPHDARVDGPATQPRSAPRLHPAPLRRSLPLTVRIPAIGINARIVPLGLGRDHTVEVPSLSTPMLTSWFDNGAAPGQRGAAVLFGHVDSALTGPAVFYRLGDLRPGALIYVTRADHRTAVFRVQSVMLFSQWDFPDRRIYGYSRRPVLRLVTCGGQFDTKTHQYLDRTVAFATYLGHR